uniref:RNB domain-containing protein n=1 Tax=Macrostomum lignano TaxID=282301 RepID=A0A1I8HYK8_9PLAT
MAEPPDPDRFKDQRMLELVRFFQDRQQLDDFESGILNPVNRLKDLAKEKPQIFKICTLGVDSNFAQVAVPNDSSDNDASPKHIYMNKKITMAYGTRFVVEIIESSKLSITRGIFRGRLMDKPAYNMKTKAQLMQRLQNKPDKYKVCRLHLDGPQLAWAYPLSAEDPIQKIQLKGRSNSGRACEDDEVIVKVLEVDENGVEAHGTVVGMWRQNEKLKYKLFVCEVIEDYGTLMRPLCASVPKIGYDNRFAIWEHQRRIHKFMTPAMLERQAKGMLSSSQILSMNPHEFANKNFVSVYSPVEDDSSEEIEFVEERCERILKHDCDKLFIVCFEDWPVDRWYPRGKVVHVVLKEPSFLKTLDLIQVSLSVPPHIKLTCSLMTRQVMAIERRVQQKVDLKSEKREDFRNNLTVTIDGPDTKDMDDAISLAVAKNGKLIVGVHITDLTEFVGENTPIDREARRRGTTYYPNKGAQQMGALTNHMLPRQLAEKSISLVEGQDRRCMSVVISLNANGLVESSRICLTVIRSDKRLNKEDVQRVLDGETGALEPRIEQMLLRLWSVTRDWRLARLGQAAFVRQENESYPETSALVEELMLAANSAVGDFLHKQRDSVPAYPIRVQQRPREIDVTRWIMRHGPKTTHSAELSRALKLVGKEVPGSNIPFQMHNEDAKNLRALCQRGDNKGALSLLYDERRFPHLKLAIRDWHGLCELAQYIRCVAYADIMVHRALRVCLKSIQSVECSYGSDEICRFLTAATIRNKRFSRRSKGSETALQLKEVPQRVVIQVSQLDEDGIVFRHEYLDSEPRLAKLVQYRFLNLCEKPEEKEPTMAVCCKWKARILLHTTVAAERSPNDRVGRTGAQTWCDPIKVASFSSVTSFRPTELLRAKNELQRHKWDYSKCELSSSSLLEADLGDRRGVSNVYSTPDGHGSVVRFYRDIHLGDEVNGQIGAMSNHGMLVPTLKLIEICDTFAICLAHRRRPVDSFEHALRHYIKVVYQDIDEYVKIWQNFVAMEAATVSVSNNEAFVLCEVPIVWRQDKRNNRWLGMFNLTSNFCSANNLSFTDSVVTEELKSWRKKLEKTRKNSEKRVKDVTDAVFTAAQRITRYSEYICLRANIRNEYTWIGHGGVLLVFDGLHCRSNRCNDKSVHFCNFVVFHLNEVSPGDSAPQETLTNATIEIVMKFLPIRRHELVLQAMRHQRGINAADALVRWDEQKNAEGVDFLIYKNTLVENSIRSYDIRVGNENAGQNLRLVPCNDCQRQALETAIKKRISLIWGPPGTGKTTTGVMLIFWFVFINRNRKDAMPAPDIILPNDDDEEYNEFEDTQYSDDEEDEEQDVQDVFEETEGLLPEFEDRKDAVDAELTRANRDGFEEVVYRRKSRRRLSCSTSAKTLSDSRRWNPQPIRKCQSRRQILCCGPSNRSVDVIIEASRDLLADKCPSMVRVYSEQVERMHYPVPGEISTADEVSPAMRRFALHELIRSENSDDAYIIGGFDDAFKLFIGSKTEAPVTMEAAIKTAAGRNPRFDRFIRNNRLRSRRRGALELAEEEAGEDALVQGCVKLYKDKVQKSKERVLQNFDVVLCTTSVSCSSVLQRACRFVQIIIDEAGMCTQPELLVPIVGRLSTEISVPSSLGASNQAFSRKPASQYAERVVLIGDHKQLAPIIQNKTAAELGLSRTFLEMHCLDSVMLNQQYRMHPSLADFPSKRFYTVKDSGGLRTQPSKSWTGVLDAETRTQGNASWTGLNWHRLAKHDLFDSRGANGVRRHGLLTQRNANVLHGCWPGVRRNKPFDTLPDVPAKDFHPMGEEERIVFLHIQGHEERTLVATEDGREDSYKNELEIDTVVRVYKEIHNRLSGDDKKDPRRCIAVMSQYKYQVSEITRRLKEENLAMPTVNTVIACQGSEFAYVLLSLVRSMPDYDIEANPLPGWERKFLGFITDENQTNVALTRAQRGLVIVGNRKLLRRDPNWSYLLHDLKERGCIPKSAADFPNKTGDKRFLTRTGKW